MPDSSMRTTVRHKSSICTGCSACAPGSPTTGKLASVRKKRLLSPSMPTTSDGRRTIQSSTDAIRYASASRLVRMYGVNAWSSFPPSAETWNTRLMPDCSQALNKAVGAAR